MDWKKIVKKFTSRKFLTALGTEAGLLVALYSPEAKDIVMDTIIRGGTVIGLILVPIVYMIVQGSVDKLEE